MWPIMSQALGGGLAVDTNLKGNQRWFEKEINVDLNAKKKGGEQNS